MSLFKIYRGNSSVLPGGKDGKTAPDGTTLEAHKLHDGYAYFCADTGEFFIDVDLVGDGTGLKRVQINAFAATKLKRSDTKFIEIEDIVLTTDIIDVEHGGTGANSLQLNAVLVGNGTDTVKAIPASLGAFYVDETNNGTPKFGVLPVAQGGLGVNTLTTGGILVGNAEDGTEKVTTLTGTGVLYSSTIGAPEFGVAPVTVGGTGASSPENARENLEVYSKDEVNTEINKVTTVAYPHTLEVTDWAADEQGFVATWTEPKLQCGKNHNVPPEITFTSNRDEYNKINKAVADTETHTIKFYIDNKPTGNIEVIIIDQM